MRDANEPIRVCAQCGEAFEDARALGIICGDCDYRNAAGEEEEDEDAGADYDSTLDVNG